MDSAVVSKPGEEYQAGVACPVDRQDCWIVDALNAIPRIARDVASYSDDPSAPSQLAKHTCQLMGAEAAWLFRAVDAGQRLSLASDHVPIADADTKAEVASHARHLAERLMLAAERHEKREENALPIIADDGYIAVLLSCRQQTLGVIVVQDSRKQGHDIPARQESLASLASQISLAFENALLHDTRRELETKLRQLGLHRTDYVATLSHELRTPLTSIKGFAQLLTRENGVTPDAARRYAATIAAEADRLSLIVTDIVDLTRMETGLLELRRRPISLGRLLRNAVQRLQPIAFPQKLTVNIPERLPIVRGDPERLAQALERMLVDSFVQARQGSTILLSAEAGDDGIAVRLEYPTTEERIASLIDAMKGPNGQSNDGQATQLGKGRLVLYICKNYIEAHGGKMWVECPEEQTARVMFTLPY
ncbi:MAG TPA: histidine kinase dimerization/phospho-acceptor domain-containing protein [Chloroflexota bacterium]|nr:histidine kinase dimerization/phospho-acceptor domain-containing protein [Chloroflexota bacterium]